jgi:bifunctional non-homologous end joining protein LigD
LTGPLIALQGPESQLEVAFGGRTVRLTNLDKVLWPQTGTTKRDLLTYYARVAGALLAHLEDRPLSLGRYPDGVDGVNWFQTTCPHPPKWMRTHAVPGRGGGRPARAHCVVDDVAGLLWVANLASIELHPLLLRMQEPEEATALVFDLDPGPGTSIEDCCVVALELRELLASSRLAAFAKTTGSAGLHVFVPLNGRQRFPHVKGVARALAASLQREAPGRVATRKKTADRVGRVLVDWAQNDPARSTVAPYSLRAMPWPAASIPLTWEEVHDGAARGLGALPVTGQHAIERLDALGDLFSPVLTMRQELPRLAP